MVVVFAEAGARAWSAPSEAEVETGRVSDALARVPALRDAELDGGSRGLGRTLVPTLARRSEDLTSLVLSVSWRPLLTGVPAVLAPTGHSRQHPPGHGTLEGPMDYMTESAVAAFYPESPSGDCSDQTTVAGSAPWWAVVHGAFCDRRVINRRVKKLANTPLDSGQPRVDLG